MTVLRSIGNLVIGGMLLSVFGQAAWAQGPLAAPLLSGASPPRQQPAPPAPQETRGKANQELPNPYKQLFFNNDFSYLDAPGYVSRDPFDALKRIQVAQPTLLDIGGDYRVRFHAEDNLGLNGRDNHYLLQRGRLYGDVRHDGWLRFFCELIDSGISYNSLPPRTSEEYRADFTDLFFDVKLWEDDRGGQAWTRTGRQELDLGSQRLLASAEWANDRLTFDGVKAFWKSKTWDVDAFWTRPVPFARTGDGDRHNFRPADPTVQFLGVSAIWHEVKGQTVEFVLPATGAGPAGRTGRPAPGPVRREHLRRPLAGSPRRLAMGIGRRLPSSAASRATGNREASPPRVPATSG